MSCGGSYLVPWDGKLDWMMRILLQIALGLTVCVDFMDIEVEIVAWTYNHGGGRD